MPHIHEGPGQHDFTVSFWISREDSGEDKLLFHFHKKLGSYLQPGGHIELNEHPWQAAAHELDEETGYPIGDLQVYQPASLPILSLRGSVVHPTPVMVNTHNFGDLDHKHTDLSYAFRADDLPKGLPHEGESTDLKWLGVSDLDSLVSDKLMMPDTAEMAKFVLREVVKEWRLVDSQNFHL